MSYRDDVEALAQRCEALERNAHSASRELEEARRLLEEARARRRLPVLDNLHIASPCSADWSQMSGDSRVRHCGACDKDVYDLSAMTRAEAETLLVEREGSLCVRYFQRSDGTILTADCPVGQTRRRRRRRIAGAAFGAMTALAAAGAALACRASLVMGAMPAPQRQQQVQMGEVPAGPQVTIERMGDPAPRTSAPRTRPAR